MGAIDGGVGGIERSAKDGKWPAYQHYPGDFERDLAGNSLAAQGLWIRMLGWMHQNEAHRGFLELPNGEPMTEKQISLRIGRSIKEVRPLLAELKSFGVFSVTPSGTLYCRRMARETHISEVRRAAAKSRADKAARAEDGSFVGGVAGLGGGGFAPAKIPPSGEQNTVLSSSSSVSSSVSVKATPCASNGDAHLTGLSGHDQLFGTLEKTIPVAKRASQMSAEQEGWFTTWWAEYWRHVAKKAAREAFRKKVRTVARFEQVMTATRAQKTEMLSREESVRPHGATWLHGERWADETALDASPGSSATRSGGKGSNVIDEAMRLYDARLTE
jgi:hypothetical protein